MQSTTKIKRLRKEKGMTQAKLAQICECSISLISQIETGVINPSLKTLSAISNALGVPIAQIIRNNNTFPQTDSIFQGFLKPEDRKVLTLRKGGVYFELLSQGINLPFEYVLCVYMPNCMSGAEVYSHEGKECGYLLEGELIVQIKDQKFKLEPNQSITFDSTTPHRLINEGKKKAVAVWVNSVPYLFSIS